MALLHCGSLVESYHNPDPIRDGNGQNCCDECNTLVREARIRIVQLPEEEVQSCILRIREMTYPQLKEAFSIRTSNMCTLTGEAGLVQELNDLCLTLQMPAAVTRQLLSVVPELDMQVLEPAIRCLFEKENWENGLSLLKQQLGEDPNGMKMLTCQLLCALKTRDNYQKAGISEEIFLATMDCFPRFVKEHLESFGLYGFDREWWTVRQLSGVLFRVGLLEYELRENAISLHIPSGARLEPEAVDTSLKAGRAMVVKHFPAYADAPMVCHSWLLSPTLKALLPVDSNILRFQQRFAVTPTAEAEDDYLVWVFKNKDIPLPQLPEQTALQRKLKAHLLQGGIFQDARGVLKE